MGYLLTTASTLMCPHGGMIVPVPSDQRVLIDGVPIVLDTDFFVIAGCPFVIGAVPHPCLFVQWIVTAMQVSVSGGTPLTTDSIGFCLGPDRAVQGPVVIVATQMKVSGL